MLLFWIGLMLLLFCVWILMTITGARWFFRWGAFVLLLTLTLTAVAGWGAVAGYFGHTPVNQYRRHFFDEFARIAADTPDFAAAMTTMREQDFSGLRDKLLPPPPPLWRNVIGIVFLCLAAAGEITLRQHRWRVWPIALLSLGAALPVAAYCYQANFSAFSRRHLQLTVDAETQMLEDFARRAPEVTLSPADCAAAIRSYIDRESIVCHGEPYSSLEETLWPKPAE